MSAPSFERLVVPLRSSMFSGVTAANALSQRANDSASNLTMSAFLRPLPASVGLPLLSRFGGRVPVSPESAKHEPLLSSATCDKRPPHVRTSGVGDQSYLSSGN